jgi:hypothetical protein
MLPPERGSVSRSKVYVQEVNKCIQAFLAVTRGKEEAPLIAS